MNIKSFTIYFFSVFVVAFVALVFIFQSMNKVGGSREILTILWASLLMILVLLGIISFSLFFRHIGKKKK
ncbi:MAG: hypothetical protein Q7S74_06505 [Nanoarchaeota archaeon]|nr:hypothetical protein [Nanoarchaeota archaeon]